MEPDKRLAPEPEQPPQPPGLAALAPREDIPSPEEILSARADALVVDSVWRSTDAGWQHWRVQVLEVLEDDDGPTGWVAVQAIDKIGAAIRGQRSLELTSRFLHGAWKIDDTGLPSPLVTREILEVRDDDGRDREYEGGGQP